MNQYPRKKMLCASCRWKLLFDQAVVLVRQREGIEPKPIQTRLWNPTEHEMRLLRSMAPLTPRLKTKFWRVWHWNRLGAPFRSLVLALRGSAALLLTCLVDGGMVVSYLQVAYELEVTSYSIGHHSSALTGTTLDWVKCFRQPGVGAPQEILLASFVEMSRA